MREILFRGKRLDNNEWAYGNLIIWNDGSACIDNGNTIDYMIAIDPETIGEYTGIKDKNGNRIFEGDIITGLFMFGMQKKAICGFRDGSFGAFWERGGHTEFSPFTGCCNIEWEVIGNTYDNPELMEGEQ